MMPMTTTAAMPQTQTGMPGLSSSLWFVEDAGAGLDAGAVERDGAEAALGDGVGRDGVEAGFAEVDAGEGRVAGD
jgi:hypothetical protein